MSGFSPVRPASILTLRRNVRPRYLTTLNGGLLLVLVGPVFFREAAIAPRRPRTYAARGACVLALLIMMSTAWLVLTGTQEIRGVGDMARFGNSLFQILAPLQLLVAIFSAALTTASAVAQEKDRQTLLLLLLTRMNNNELVLGRLLASLLNVLMLLATALPVFVFVTLFGGVSVDQVLRVFAVTLVSVVACGSLGSTLALSREKTFQALAATVLALVLWLAAAAMVDLGLLGSSFWGIDRHQLALALSPWHAVVEASRPHVDAGADVLARLLGTTGPFLVCGSVAALLLNGLAIALVRVWNPSREAHGPVADDENRTSMAAAAATTVASVTTQIATPTRAVWDNPVLWREIRTWAYGRRMIVIRLAYLTLFALAAAASYAAVGDGQAVAVGELAGTVAPLFLLSLVLVNAQAVTSLTSERDAKALDLLLVSDISPKEFVFGKLGGVFYNTKEMLLLPMALAVYLWGVEAIGLETFVYLVLGSAVLFAFVAVLGVHIGMNYDNSRSAVATSLGTVFFLSLGVATCMRMMLAFSGSFETQLQPFLAFMVGGGIGLYLALGARNPSTAIAVASFTCPLATFYALTSLLMGQTHLGFIAVVAAYGFTTAAMLIPAVDEFDVATGRTTIAEQ